MSIDQIDGEQWFDPDSKDDCCANSNSLIIPADLEASMLRISHLWSMASGGTVSVEEAYQSIVSSWEELKRLQESGEISQP